MSTARLQPTEQTLSNSTDSASGPTGTPIAKQDLKLGLDSFGEKISELLKPDAAGNVHEEQLQHAVVQHLLEIQDKELARSFDQIFSSLVARGDSVEDAVRRALFGLVEGKQLSLDDANLIHGASFRAAQLDRDLTALFDNRGSANDATVAVAPLSSAISQAKSVLEGIADGSLSVQSRSVHAPSNSVAISSASGQASTSSSSSSGVGRAGFLWKPVSENDGKLVVLLPPGLSGKVTGAGIFSGNPPTNENFIESGRFTGDSHNGGRAHFRFSKPGGSYPDGTVVVAQLRDGSSVSFQVGDSSARNG